MKAKSSILLGMLLAVLFPVTSTALVELPPDDPIARQASDFASCATAAEVIPVSLGLLDDRAYLSAYRERLSIGLSHARAAKLEAWQEARQEGGLVWRSLAPTLSLRAAYLSEGAEEQVLPNGMGRRVYPGANSTLNAWGAMFWGEGFGGEYDLDLNVWDGGSDATVRRLYGKARLGKWSLKIGRDAERLGPGYHGNIMLSADAPGYLLWRLRSEEPLYIPWGLEWLGGFRVMLLNGYLDDDSPSAPDSRYGDGVASTEDPRLFAMRLSMHPARWLDLGLTRVVFYGGSGRKSYDRPGAWWELVTASDENSASKYDSDQLAALDVTIRIPHLAGLGGLKGAALYMEYAGTDVYARWQGDDEFFQLSGIAVLAGLHLTTGWTELRLEYARTSPEWYAHHHYSQGYSYRGVPLGHHAGGDARDFFAEVSRNFDRRWQGSISFDLEKRGRTLPTPERRTELAAALRCQELKMGALALTGEVQALWRHLDAPLTDALRKDRDEYLFALSVTGPF